MDGGDLLPWLLRSSGGPGCFGRGCFGSMICRNYRLPPFIFSTPHGRTVFSIESCGYCITFNLFHLRLASHSELARLNIMSWNSTLCILL